MKRTLFVAAFAVGAMLMPAAFAQQPQNSASEPLSSAPAANPPMSEMQPGARMPEGMMQRRMMMMHHRMARRNPKEACIDRLARRAGVIAYVGAKLNLTAEQRPLWDKIQSTVNDEAQQERKLCEAIKPPAEETALDRLTRMEQMDAARLAGLRTAIPEVRQLYQALTPAQRAILDHPFRG
ncbi:MAG TPA: Spy/CpxP family protein refolding chaperone [Stellaceae bacterium]|nr:Spy/CpxP family protein refolding chaperone [Stellaceae bacterium]